MITGVSYGQYLNPPRSIATPETACIVAEIAERLAELEEKRFAGAQDLVHRLAAIASISPRMFRHVVALLHGDTLNVVESFAVQADKRGLTKQALHCEWWTEIGKVKAVFPDIAAILVELRKQADNHDVMIAPDFGPNRAEDEAADL
jgi:hypothetical protein